LSQAAGAPARAWGVVTGLLMLPAVLAWWLPAPLLDWQPGLAWQEPWRWFSAAWVHWSENHLLANLAAAAVVGAYGWAAPLPRAQALAWLAAWPLTQLGLLTKPDLLHYGGLSGVLHAGVAITSLWLLVQARGGRRAVGAAVMLGLVIKLLGESPWGPALQRSAEFDIALAPVAHASGALAGLLCGGVALLLHRRVSPAVR
jgi:rhomboid family GlyGly-CTERM serine protease